MQRDTIEEEKISHSIDESQQITSVSISIEIGEKKKESKSFWHILFCVSFWSYCFGSKNKEEEQKENSIKKYIKDLKLKYIQQAKQITKLLQNSLSIPQQYSKQISQNEKIEQKKQLSENSITSQIINFSIQSHMVNVPNKPKQPAFSIQTQLINFSYQLKDTHQNLEINVNQAQANQNQQFNQIQENPQQLQNTQPKRNIRILGIVSSQDNQQHIEQPFVEFEQRQNRQQLVPQQQQQQQSELKQNSELIDDSLNSTNNFERLKTLPGSSNCMHCQQEIIGPKIQTSCFHYYHQECFDEMIEIQVVNKNNSEIQCQCSMKLKMLTLTLVSQQKQQQIKQQLYLNQIEQIKQGLISKGMIQHCKTQNCPFFYIDQQGQESFCDCCQK